MGLNKQLRYIISGKHHTPDKTTTALKGIKLYTTVYTQTPGFLYSLLPLMNNNFLQVALHHNKLTTFT